MKQKVLIVDDSAPIHELLKMHLEGEPYRIDSAFDGISGLATAASPRPPDLILLDVDLPDMNGFDVCRRLKADPKTAGIAVIFLTAAQSSDDKVCGLELKALDYITKPFDGEELRARLRAALRIKRLMDLVPDLKEESETESEEAGFEVPGLSNPRPTYRQLMLARSRNPWHRVPPRASPDATNSSASELLPTE